MLSPEYLYRVSERSESIASDLYNYLISMIVERLIIRANRGDNYLLTSSDLTRISIIEDAGRMREDIVKEIAKQTRRQEKEIWQAMNEAGQKALAYDDKVYEQAGLSPSPNPLNQSSYYMRLMERNYRATMGEWNNYTRTTADAAQRRFIEAADKAYNKAATGAVSTTQAVAEAVKEVASGGAYIEYPTGHRNTIETATLRTVRTGIAQMSADIQIARMEEMNWDIVLTSAHLGARTGDFGENPGNHEWWQGKFFSRKGNSPFPDFVDSTGYGSVTGLCGVNCRHSFGPGDGVNNPFVGIDTKENRRVEELNKRQRELERRIRKTKREVLALQTAVDTADDNQLKFELQLEYDKKAALLTKQNKAYNEFVEKNNLKSQNDRLKIAGWEREQAAKASGAARRYNNAKSK